MLRRKLTEEEKEQRRKTALKKGYEKWMYGRKRSKETIEKIRKANIGKKLTEEHKNKISLAHKGKKKSNQHKINIGLAFKGKKWNLERIKSISGEKNHRWKGGIAKGNRKIRNSREYRLWREAVFERDNYKCIWCGSAKNIQADHIKQFAYFPELRFAIDNGRTLCKKCHITTDTFCKHL